MPTISVAVHLATRCDTRELARQRDRRTRPFVAANGTAGIPFLRNVTHPGAVLHPRCLGWRDGFQGGLPPVSERITA